MTPDQLLARLNSGEIHARLREKHPDCVCKRGNIHGSPERARFEDWRYGVIEEHGQDHALWPAGVREEFERRYVPSTYVSR